MLILSFSSFTRFEEIQCLLVGQVFMVDQDFSIQFHKGKTYLESRFGVIPFINSRDFNPAGIFVLYLERVAMLHATQNSVGDFLFPNVVLNNCVVTLCDRPLVYNYFLKLLKTEASLAHLSCVKLKLKLGLHSLRRGQSLRLSMLVLLILEWTKLCVLLH